MGCPVENNACEKESFFAFLNKKSFFLLMLEVCRLS